MMMNQSRKMQIGRLVGSLLLLVGLCLAGCADPAEKMRKRLGEVADMRLHSALRGSLAATGGLENWASLRRIEGDVLATVFEPDGQQVLVQQQHLIVPGDKLSVKIYSNEPGGLLQEQLDRKGRVRLLIQGQVKALPPTDPDELRGTNIKLRLLAQALTGAAGLLREGYQLRYAGSERKGGRLMHKIEVTGPILGSSPPLEAADGNLLVIWIDARTSLVDRLWLRFRLDDGKFGYLAVNVDKYMKTPQGLLLPQYIVFMRGDEYQQFSERQLLLFEYQHLQVITEK